MKIVKEFLIIFVIAIVFIVDCGYTVETDCCDSECDCKSLLEHKIDSLVDGFELNEKGPLRPL